MKDERKTKKQLINELIELRHRIEELEKTKTERKLAEEALRESEKRYRTLFSEAIDGICLADAETGIIIDCNKALAALVGRDSAEMIGQPQTILHPPSGDNTAFSPTFKQHLTRDGQVLDTQVVTKTGEIREVEIKANLLYLAEGKVLQGIFRDITERKKAEEELRNTKEYLEKLTNALPDVIFTVKFPERTHEYFNKSGERILGYNNQECIGKNTLKFYANEDEFNDLGKKLNDAIEQGKEIVYTEQLLKRKNGEVFPGELTLTFLKEDGKVTRLIGIVRDITKHKRADEALRQSEEKHRALIETTDTGYLILDAQGRVIDSNKEYIRLTGYDALEEILGRGVVEWTAPYDLERNAAEVKRCVEQGYVRNLEIDYVNRSGQITPIELNATVLGSGDSARILSLCRDITKRKRAEEMLRQSEERHRSIVENVRDVIFTISQESLFTSISFAFESITGWLCAEWIGKSFASLIHPDDLPLAKEMVNLALKGESPTMFELRIRSKYSGYLVGEFKITPQMKNGKTVGVLGVGRDITERKNLEAQLLHAQKMEAVGQLAGGVAHDFNNILQAIIGYASLLQMKMKKDDHDPLRHNVDQILASSERAANLTQSLLVFSRKQIISLKPVRLNEIIKRVEKLLSRVISEDIELKTILTDKDLTVMADSGQIEQVLMNLATNARDAMPDGGLLTMGTEIVELGEEYIKTHGYGKPGKYALISFTDTGTGMNKERKEKIFEPFFTTKEVGKGTGLGLSMVYGIIKQHNGYIGVYSAPGKGTTFKIYLPLTKAGVEERKPTETTITIGGTETILLAEDDANVRTFTKSVLEEFGYTVIEAADGEDAINKFMEHRDKIGLLLLDVIMPKKNGKEVYEEIRKTRPEIKVLFMSGYTANVIHKEGILEEGLKFVLKPISPTKLLRKVREVLDK